MRDMMAAGGCGLVLWGLWTLAPGLAIVAVGAALIAAAIVAELRQP